MTTEQGLMAAIIASPDDDLPRLVYADWLDENGDVDRAEFVRIGLRIAELEAVCQCHLCRRDRGEEPQFDRVGDFIKCDVPAEMRERYYVLREPNEDQWFGKIWASPWVEGFTSRGFVNEIHCTPADWLGGDCWRCAPLPLYRDRLPRREWREPDGACETCDGLRWTAPHGPDLVARLPIQTVRLLGTKPADRTCVNGSFYWFKDERPVHNGANNTHTAFPEARLPAELFTQLDGAKNNPEVIGLPFESEESANSALSVACIRWAKLQNEARKNPKVLFSMRREIG